MEHRVSTVESVRATGGIGEWNEYRKLAEGGGQRAQQNRRTDEMKSEQNVETIFVLITHLTKEIHII